MTDDDRPDDDRPDGEEAPHVEARAAGSAGGAGVAGAARASASGASGSGRRGPLRRDSEDKMVAGVCTGLGRYVNLDPVIFRVVLAALTLSGGLGLLLYALGWLLTPMDTDGRSELHRLLHGRFDKSGGQAVLAVLISAGVFVAFFGNGPGFFPWLLMALCIAAVSWHRRRGPNSGPLTRTGSNSSDTVPEEPAAPAPAQSPAWWQRETPLPDSADADAASPAAVPTGTAADVSADAPTPTPPPPPPSAAAPADGDGRSAGTGTAPYGEGRQPAADAYGPRRSPARPQQRERSLLGKAVACTALLAGVLVGLLTNQLGGKNQLASIEVGLVTALFVLGLGLVAGAWFGRVRTGVIVLASLVSLALAGASALPSSVNGRWADELWKPESAAAVQHSYELGAGRARLDLTDIQLKRHQTVRTTVSVGIGKVTVHVPKNARVRVHATEQTDWHSPDQPPGETPSIRTGTKVLYPSTARHGTVVLTVNADIGDVRVARETS